MAAEEATEVCRLDEQVVETGVATIGYPDEDAGAGGSGLRLMSLGKVRNESGSVIYTIWGVRNGSDSDKEVVVDGYGGSFKINFTALAHSETILRSNFADGAATHRLFCDGGQVDVEAAGEVEYADERPIPCLADDDQQVPAADEETGASHEGGDGDQDLLAYEGFDYAASDAIHQHGAAGNGWSGPWKNVRSRYWHKVLVAEGSLSYGNLEVSGNHAAVDNSTAWIYRPLASAVGGAPDTEIWLSFIMGDDSGNRIGAWSVFAPINSRYGYSRDGHGIADRLFDIGIFGRGDHRAFRIRKHWQNSGWRSQSRNNFGSGSVPWTPGDHFVLVRLSLGTDASHVAAWVDPQDPTDLGAPDLTLQGNHNGPVSFDGVMWHVEPFHSRRSARLDEIRIGRSAASVTKGLYPAPSAEFSVQPDIIHRGESATLSWSTSHANTLSIEPGIGPVAPSGALEVSPEQTTVYTLTAAGPGGMVSKSVTVTVANSPPQAQDQSVSTQEDTSVDITLVGTDPDNNQLIFRITAEPEHGQLSGNPPAVVYTPGPNYNGTDSFSFVVNDGSVDSEPAVVGIEVTAVNDAPVAVPDFAVTAEDVVVTIDNVLANDTDVDGDTLLVSRFSQPTHGKATSLGGGRFEYTPDPNYFGEDSFIYFASDGNGRSDVATVTITVTPVNDAPVANPAALTLDEDGEAPVELTGEDIEGTTLIFEILSGPSHGTLSGQGAALTYQPNPNYWGSDSFTFRVFDGELYSAPAKVSLTIHPVNDPPVAYVLATELPEDSQALLELSGSDVDGDQLTFELVTPPSHGVLSGDFPNPTYTPTANYNGPDSFSFRVYDGQLYSDAATVTLTVQSVNDAPVAKAGEDITVFVRDPVPLDAGQSYDVDGDALTFQWTLVRFPEGSAAALVNASASSAGFVPDVAGTYEVELIVGDGSTSSTPDAVLVTAVLRTVAVPDVVNRSRASAEAAIQEAGLAVGTVSSANSETVAAGYVITQDPAAGEALTEGSLVNMVISTGPAIKIPSVSFSASPSTVSPGESANLTWSSSNGTIAYIDNQVGSVPVNSEISVSPENTTLYTIVVSGEFGSASAQAVVRVAGEPEPLPEGSFAKQYEDLIPPDATIPQYDSNRFSLILGKVEDREGLPISDVLISIHGHPDYGTAMTGPAGRFTLPVEGGGSLIVDYQKAGLLSAQRRVDVPWNGHAVAETVQMISEDPVGTNLHFDGDPNTVVTHRSSTVSDEFGKRSCSVVFSGDNQARLLDERGNPVQQLDSITVRATEFATEASMPAKLPPNSAYTYCVELGVDGAQRVRFDKPVVVWVDNFLGFDVGEIVPVGYFDRDRGVWVPSDNGVVVRLLDLNQDGIVDALDANDDGQPDDLDHDGSISDDVKGLEDPQAYVPGSTYWRFTVSHFSPWDCNWPYSFPTGAQAPNPIGDASVNSENGTINSCSLATNSYVKLRSRVYHEDIPIPGTDIALHYASNRVEGYQYQITVPVSGDTVPSSLERIIVQLEVAGLTFEKILPPLPNQITDFVWNSRDYLGRPVSNKTDAKVGIGFVYKGVYYTARSDTLQAFAQAGQYLTRILTRQEAISWRYTRLPINPFPIFEANHNIAAGWTLSVHHQIHETDPSTLHKGDGEVVSNNVTEIIDTVAGGGSRSLVPGDRFPATEARLVHPRGLAVDAQGNLYIGDGNLGSWNRVFKVDSFGYISEIPIGAVKDICDVAVDSEGNLYVADGNGCRVVKVDTEGRITTVAGDGTHDYSGDGGPASQARLSYPTGVAVDQEGNLYIADQFNSRVRKVDPSGIITTVAGNGSSGSAGSFDGIPAVESRVSAPADVAIDAAGNLYIADRFENRIRKVDASGIITTVAGTGSSCDSSLSDCGDGGPATKAQLETPYGIAVDAVGNLYIADTGLSKVRKVNANGVIRSLTSRDRGYSGDGGPSVEAMLFFANNIAVDPLGGIYVSTGNSYSTSRVRKIGLPGVFRKTMAEGDNVFAEENGYGYVISKSGQHKYTIEQDTGVVLRRFDYDEQKNLIAMTDRFDNSIIIERNQEGVPTAIVSPDGIRTELTIDDNNHLVEIGYPDGNSYQFQYAGSGLMTTEIEPAGNRFNHTYDELGRLTDVYDEEGGHWKHTNAAYRNGDVQTEVVTGEGNVTDFLDNIDPAGVFRSVITDPTGAQTNYEQSSDGLRVSKSLPCGMVLDSKYSLDRVYQYKYVGQMTERSPAGLQQVTLRARLYGTDSNLDGVPDSVTEKVTTNGKVSERAVDTRNSEKRYSSPEGRTIIESYDANTLLTERVQIPGLFETDYSYDDRGRLTSIDTNTRETRFAYNNRGFLEFITDPENHTTQFVYDPVGRVTHIVRPDTNVLEFEYDENGNKTMLVNPAGVDHEFDYNRVNNQCAYITPLSGVYQYKYDKDRRLTETIFPSAKRIRNTYEDGQLVQTETPEGIIDYDYLCASKVGSITKGGERIAFDYDGKLVTRETLTGTVNQQLSYSYDNDFEVTEFSYAGNTTAYAYDKDGLLTGAGDFTITRDAGNGLPLQVSDGTLTAARSFNGYGEIESQSAGASGQQVSSWSVSRDANGRIIRKTEVVAGISATYDYEYDAMGRLRKVFKDGALVEEYRYNANGTRIYEMNALRGIAGRTFEYSEEDHLLIAGDTQYQHDQDGFLTNKANLTNPANPTSYIYSSRGELLRATLPDGEIIEYVHDPLGRRIAKKVNGELVEKYLWQGLTRLLAVYDGSDKLMRFEYADDRMPVAMMTEGVKYYLTYDQVGSLRSVADSAGNVVKRITYDSFGNIIEDTNNAFVVPFGFAGGLHDRDTGLVRFGYRDYDPETGRWTAKDPILFTGGDTDLYGYCLSDPINSTDLEGKFGIPGAILGGVVGGIFGGLGAYIGGSDATGIIAGIAAGALGGAVGGGLGLGSAAGAGLGAFINAFGAALVGANPGGMFGAALGGAAGGAFGGLPGLGLLGIYAGGMIAGSWGLAYGFIGEAIYNELFRHKPAQPDGPC